jgi:hypothetical protein
MNKRKISLQEFIAIPKMSYDKEIELLQNGADDLIRWYAEKITNRIKSGEECFFENRKVIAILFPKLVEIRNRPVQEPIDLNALMMRFPKGVQLFTNWLDERDLIKNRKFHDLPLGIQTGLMELFFFDKIGCHQQEYCEYVKLFELLNRS